MYVSLLSDDRVVAGTLPCPPSLFFDFLPWPPALERDLCPRFQPSYHFFWWAESRPTSRGHISPFIALSPTGRFLPPPTLARTRSHIVFLFLPLSLFFTLTFSRLPCQFISYYYFDFSLSVSSLPFIFKQ